MVSAPSHEKTVDGLGVSLDVAWAVLTAGGTIIL